MKLKFKVRVPKVRRWLKMCQSAKNMTDEETYIKMESYTFGLTDEMH